MNKIKTLAEVEREYILKTLEHFDGNKTLTAQALGVSQKTIYNKLNHYMNQKGVEPVSDRALRIRYEVSDAATP